jgi:hypothetical protein
MTQKAEELMAQGKLMPFVEKTYRLSETAKVCVILTRDTRAGNSSSQSINR